MAPDVQSPSETKQLVLDFYELAFVQRDAAQAAERFLSPDYKQHNPQAPDGPEAFVGMMAHILAQAPEVSFDLKRVVAEDDLVVLHHHLKMTPEDRGSAVVDIFRVADGRIAEHWDVIQPVPEGAANANGMF